jgi:hypothetical protein
VRHNFVKTDADVTTRVGALHRRFDVKHRDWLQLDAWRHMDDTVLESEIWGGMPEDMRRFTVVKTDIAAITDTGVAFLVGDDPIVETLPLSPGIVADEDRANELERVGEALLRKLDEDRSIPLFEEGAEFVFHRGHLVGQALVLDPDQRGEERVKIQAPLGLAPDGVVVPDREEIVREGSFPLLLRQLDPAECFWTLGGKHQVVEFLHEYQTTLASALDLFPDILTKPQFASLTGVSALDNVLTIRDYWDETINAIFINDIAYKHPTAHGYDALPFVVELAHIQTRDTKGSNQNGIGAREQWGVPFCQPILQHVRMASWADSITAPYLELIAYATLKHKGLDPRPGQSPSVDLDDDGNPIYTGGADLSPGGIMALFGSEDADYLRPPEIVATLQEFKQQRSRDIQLLTFAEAILTGVYQVDALSSLSVSQQKQAAMARLQPYAMAMNRFYSRLLTLGFNMLRVEWDRGDVALQLATLVGDNPKPVELTPQLLDRIGAIRVQVKPKVPVNPEAENQALYHGLTLDVYTLREVQERVGVQDPSGSLKRRVFEKQALNNPDFMNAIAWEYANDQGIFSKNNPYNQQAAPPPPPPMAPGPAEGALVPPGPSGGVPGLNPGGGGMGPPGLPAMGAPGAPPQGGVPLDPAMMQAALGGGQPMPGQGPPMDPSMMRGGGAPGGMDMQTLMAMMQSNPELAAMLSGGG